MTPSLTEWSNSLATSEQLTGDTSNMHLSGVGGDQNHPLGKVGVTSKHVGGVMPTPPGMCQTNCGSWSAVVGVVMGVAGSAVVGVVMSVSGASSGCGYEWQGHQ